ncbi:MAG TPA: thioredoxin domain-containing protein [Polyangiales bacterium]|nr:thioredoxin domain-containing protein [Polyangiales bacterium]
MDQRQISLGWGAAALASALMLGSLGCNQSQSKAASSGAASPKACEDYSAKICKEAGDQSQTCASVKSTVELLTPEVCALALKSSDQAIAKLGEKKKKCDELQTKLCNDLGTETKTCDMVKTHTKTFPPERCEMMLGRYAEVLADLKKQEEKNKPLSGDKLAKLTAGEAPSFGPKDAKVTIVEFSDFQCPYCSRAANTVTELKKKYGDKVHFVFRQFPLSFHQNAHLAAQAGLAAHAQGKFWQFHDKMFENQQKLDRPALEGYAKELGLDVAAFKKALDEKTYAPTVDAELKLGEEVAVDGTPTMFLNGARVSNPTDIGELSKEIDEALKKAG